MVRAVRLSIPTRTEWTVSAMVVPQRMRARHDVGASRSRDEGRDRQVSTLTYDHLLRCMDTVDAIKRPWRDLIAKSRFHASAWTQEGMVYVVNIGGEWLDDDYIVVGRQGDLDQARAAYLSQQIPDDEIPAVIVWGSKQMRSRKC